MQIIIPEDKRFNIPEHTYDCNLVDDGTLDTVIEIDSIEHRYSWETGADIRNFDGSIIESRFIELCKSAIEDCEEHWQSKLYFCQQCHTTFPLEEERWGQCRECNEKDGYCYECDSKEDVISDFKSSNREMLDEIKSLREWLLDFRNHVSKEDQIKLTSRSIRLTNIIIKEDK